MNPELRKKLYFGKGKPARGGEIKSWVTTFCIRCENYPKQKKIKKIYAKRLHAFSITTILFLLIAGRDFLTLQNI